jgi:hypothetical protein
VYTSFDRLSLSNLASTGSGSVHIHQSQLDEFIEKHEDAYKSSRFNRTNLIAYDALTPLMILTHAKSRTFFGYKNRTCLILEKMKVIDEKGVLLKPEFLTAINTRKKV